MLCVWKGLCDLCVTTKVSPPIFPAHRSWWHPTCQMTPHDPFAWERGLPCARMCVWMCKIPLGWTCQIEGHQICLWVCARLSQCTYHLCVCVCLVRQGWRGEGVGGLGWAASSCLSERSLRHCRAALYRTLLWWPQGKLIPDLRRQTKDRVERH